MSRPVRERPVVGARCGKFARRVLRGAGESDLPGLPTGPSQHLAFSQVLSLMLKVCSGRRPASQLPPMILHLSFYRVGKALAGPTSHTTVSAVPPRRFKLIF